MSDDSFDLPRPRRSLPERILRRLARHWNLEITTTPEASLWREAALAEVRTRSACDSVLYDSLQRLRDRGGIRKQFAVVAPMPPAETGIAQSTLHTFANCDGGADIFSRFENAFAYSHLTTEEQKIRLGLEFFDISALPLALSRRNYKGLVICIGNSHHNLSVAAIFTLLTAFKPNIPVIVHLHDPWLLDVWSWNAAAQGRSLASDLENLYGCTLTSGKPAKHVALDRGALGLSAVIGEAPVSGIVVNSVAAERLVQSDFMLSQRRLPVQRAFLPVLPPNSPTLRHTNSDSGLLRLGTFGFPGPAKRTLEVIRAANLLAERGKAESIRLAGYGVADFVRNLSEADRRYIRPSHAPSSIRLEQLMADVDVAIQLRGEDRGESSGVVPQLLALRKSVVVTGHGSFTEFGAATVQISPSADLEAIASAILDAHARRNNLMTEAEAYCASHSPAQFIIRLGQFIQTLVA